MKIGILADIHEHIDNMRAALRVLETSRVDQVVVLGDLFETGAHIDQVVAMLRDVNAVGVWGNHDLGLGHEPDAEMTGKYGPSVIDFYDSLGSHFELEDCLFAHGIPTWDMTDPTIYYLAAKPWIEGSLIEPFSEFSHRLMFVGHFHRWYLATPEGEIKWDGTHSILLAPENRYFAVVHAVLDGWCAILETETGEFTPCFIG